MRASLPAFRAAIHFLPLEQTGRSNYPFQGYRPSLQFANGIWIPDYVWPEFYYKNGSRIPDGLEVPPDVDAEMYSWSDEVLPALKRGVTVGAKFRLFEGPFPEYLVAVGRVTRLGGYIL